MDNLINIKKASFKEKDLFLNFFKENLEILFPDLPLEAKEVYISSFKNILSIEKIDKVVLLGAFDKEKLVGFLLGGSPEGGIGTIVWLMVKEECQKKGIGVRLLIKAEDVYKLYHCHKIRVFTYNALVKNFYEKNSFVTSTLHKDYWWRKDFWEFNKNI